jgi:transposase
MASKSLEVINPRSAGIDIGSDSFYVDAGEEEVKIFKTFTDDCIDLKNYLKSLNIETVAMESTGIYWVNLYFELEDAGIEVYLVNGRDVKNMPGRKSDIKDCQWLRQLHSYGLLRKSFIPKGDIRVLRSLMRLRQDHLRGGAMHIHLMQKALIQMNIRLSTVINDIVGVSGLKIIEAILQGERDVDKLTAMCTTSILKKKEEEVRKSLKGQYQKEHMFALKQAYKGWQFYNDQIKECDQEIKEQLSIMTDDLPEVDQNKNKRKTIRYNKPDIEDLHKPLLKMTEGKDPIGIAGITDYSFLQIISEVGTDMSQWKNEKHFTSWLKLCPMRESSGHMSRKKKMKRTNKAGQIFRVIAQGIMNSKHLALGSFGRAIKAKRGPKIAIKAVARKIAEYYYRVMVHGVEFVEKGIEAYENMIKEKKIRYAKSILNTYCTSS